MYTFTRTLRLRPGNNQEAMAWSVQMLEKVNQISEAAFGLWTPIFSPAAGSLTFAAVVDDLTVLESTNAKALADDAYIALADKGSAHISSDPIDDQVVSFLHGDFTTGREVAVVAVVEAVVANGSFRRGAEVGIEIAKRAEAAGGAATAFGIAMSGAYGTVQWLTGYESVAELQRAESAVNGDPSFLQYLDEDAAGVFIEGSATQRFARRVA